MKCHAALLHRAGMRCCSRAGRYDTNAAYVGLINEATAVASARSVSVTLPL